MKTDKIVWGLALVFAGSVLLLDNFNIIDFYWTSIGQFWPLLLILIGTNMVLGRGKQTPWGSTVLIAVTCLVLGFIAYVGINKPTDTDSRWSWSFDEEVSEEKSTAGFLESMPANLSRAELHVKGGATSYMLAGTSANLFEAEVQRSFGKFSLEKISRDSTEVLHFNMKGQGKSMNFEKLGSNQADIRLNTQPLWDIFFELGAGEAEMDLTAYRVASLEIKGGAASFDIKLGVPEKQTNVKVKTGMAGVKLAIPLQAGCKITVDGGLTSKDFEGFEKQSDGTYITPGFAKSTQLIIVQLKGGLSDFEVSRY